MARRVETFSAKMVKKAVDEINKATGHSHCLWHNGKFYYCDCNKCKKTKSGE